MGEDNGPSLRERLAAGAGALRAAAAGNRLRDNATNPVGALTNPTQVVDDVLTVAGQAGNKTVSDAVINGGADLARTQVTRATGALNDIPGGSAVAPLAEDTAKAMITGVQNVAAVLAAAGAGNAIASAAAIFTSAMASANIPKSMQTANQNTVAAPSVGGGGGQAPAQAPAGPPKAGGPGGPP